jgi:nucleoside-diphosphate-sugar epimerase
LNRLTPLPAVAAALRASDARIVVTGCGGWLGQAALDLVDGIFGEGVTEHVAAFGASERPLTLPSGRVLPCRRLEGLADLDWPAPWLLHFAFLGRERLAGMPLDAYVAANRRIGDLVSEHLARRGAAGMFLPSSGAVYRREDRGLQGDLAADPYGALKLEDEERFAGLGRALGIPVSVIRVFNLAGPHINKLADYALATILTDLLLGRPVTIRAARPVIRSYVHVGDVLNLALAGLLAGDVAEPVDTVGESEIEIGELALAAAAALGLPEPEILRPPYDGRPADRYVGEGESFAALALRHGLALAGLDGQIVDTAGYLRLLLNDYGL